MPPDYHVNGGHASYIIYGNALAKKTKGNKIFSRLLDSELLHRKNTQKIRALICFNGYENNENALARKSHKKIEESGAGTVNLLEGKQIRLNPRAPLCRQTVRDSGSCFQK